MTKTLFLSKEQFRAFFDQREVVVELPSSNSFFRPSDVKFIVQRLQPKSAIVLAHVPYLNGPIHRFDLSWNNLEDQIELHIKAKFTLPFRIGTALILAVTPFLIFGDYEKDAFLNSNTPLLIWCFIVSILTTLTYIGRSRELKSLVNLLEKQPPIYYKRQ